MSSETYNIVQDEPWMFLDVRSNPVNGRKITFQIQDGTLFDVDVTMVEYHNPSLIKAKIEKLIASHEALYK